MELLELIKQIVREEYRGFGKDDEFKLTNTSFDPELRSSESSVKYLPKFTEIRRNLTKYGSVIRSLTVHEDDDVVEAASYAVKKLQEANTAVNQLNKQMDLHKSVSKYF